MKHIQVIVADYEARGLAPATIQNNISILRLFAGWIGKPDLVPKTDKIVSSPEKGRRAYSASEDKSWERAGVDVTAVIDRIRYDDPVVAAQLQLCHAFGLRMKESCMIRPRRDIRQEGDQWVISLKDGTKGGRYRYVPIITDWQKEVLDTAIEIARGGSMIPTGYRYAEWRNHYYWILRKNGITRADLGVTTHGLRHGYVHRRFEDCLGVPVPVKGGEAPALTPNEIISKKVQIAEELGHSRPSIVGAYTGTARSVKKARMTWALGNSDLEGKSPPSDDGSGDTENPA